MPRSKQKKDKVVKFWVPTYLPTQDEFENDCI